MPINELLPLTDFQKQIFSICNQYPDSCSYNIPAAIEFKGNIDHTILLNSLVLLQSWHPELKTRITLQNGEYLQYIGHQLPIIKKNVTHDTFNQELSNEAKKPIGNLDCPLARIIVWHISNDHCMIQMTISHIIADRTSLSILINSLWKIYNQLISGSDIGTYNAPNFSDYLKVGNHVRFDEANNYLKHLQNLTITDYIPLDYSRPAGIDFSGAYSNAEIDNNTYLAIKGYCRNHKARPYVFFATMLTAILHKLTSYKDIVLASAISTRSLKYLESLGPFVNTVLLRQALSDDIVTYEDLLSSMHRTVQLALDNSNTPFSKVVSELRKEQAIGDHIFQCMYVYNGNDFEFISNDNHSMRLLLVDNQSTKCDLTIYIFDSGKDFKIKFEYSKSIFKAETIEMLIGNMIKLSKNITSNPTLRITTQVDNHTSSSIRPYENGEYVKLPSNKLLLDHFIENFQSLSNNIAVQFKEHAYSYNDLALLSDNIAANLVALGIKLGNIIGVYTERTHELIPLIIGIWKAGGVYLPLECSSPIERIINILDTALPKIILTNDEYESNDIFEQTPCMPFTDILSPSKAGSFPTLQYPGSLDNAYLIFTSGSTGKPKGVLINHIGIYNRISWMHDDLKLTHADRILNKTSLMFDVSMWELLLPFYSGCRLIVAERHKSSDPEYLASLIQDESISIVHFVPVYLDTSFDIFKKYRFDSIRHIVCSGDILKGSTIANVYSLLTESAVINNYYGPTEASIDVSYYKCPREKLERLTPIGKPIWNTGMYLLRDGELVNDHLIPGELYISGICLANGYCNAPLLTQDRFVNINLPDGAIRAYKTGDLAMWSSCGDLIFLGRNDRQIKIRGIRIESEEIENKLESNSKVASSYVCKQTDENGFENLVAYIVLNNDIDHSDVDLQSYLLNYFTASIIPNRFIYLDKLPLMPSGKVDVHALLKLTTPKAISQTIEVSVAKDEFSAILSDIWKNVLASEFIGVNDNYFNLGGDSIKSIQIVAAARAHGFTFGVSDFLRNPTIANLAKFRESKSAVISDIEYNAFDLINTSDDHVADIENVVDAFPLSMLQRSLVYHSEVSDHYNIYVTTFKIQGKFDLNIWQKAIQQVSLDHPIMRTYFEIGTYSEPLQVILNMVKQPCEYIDIRGKTNLDEQIHVFFESEQSNIFDWSEAPLFRFYIHHLEDNLIQFTMSEPCLDGWSVAIICTAIFRLYESLLSNLSLTSTPSISLGTFIKQEKQVLQSSKHKEYWHKQISNSKKTVLIESSLENASIFRVEHRFSKEVTSRLLNLGKTNDIPFKSLLLALHCKMLSKITNQQAITTGIMSNARTENKDSEKIAGMFINVLPITVEVNNKSVIEIAIELIAIEAEVNKFRCMPYAAIMANIKEKIFDSIFNFTNFYPYKEFTDNKEFAILSMKGSDQTLFGVTLQFTLLPVENNLRLAIDFNHIKRDDPLATNIFNCMTDLIEFEVSKSSLLDRAIS